VQTNDKYQRRQSDRTAASGANAHLLRVLREEFAPVDSINRSGDFRALVNT
jgi:hypothetical protein